jgi:hypothetical protein
LPLWLPQVQITQQKSMVLLLVLLPLSQFPPPYFLLP